VALSFSQWNDVMRFERLDNFPHELFTLAWKFSDKPDEPWSARFCRVKARQPVAVRAGAKVLSGAIARSIKFATPGIVVGAISSSKEVLETGDPVFALGSAVAKALGWPWRPDLLRKKPHPSLRRTSGGSGRDAIVANVYEASRVPRGTEYVLLVDDFATRGSTINDIARALTSAASVPLRFSGVTLAKTENINYAGNAGISNDHVPAALGTAWDAVT
jgi:hypothetical protein